jgi:hypothetical protein
MARSNIHGHCIYTSPAGLCDGLSPLHPKEHAFPAGMGNFKDDIFLKDFICYQCQKRFSKLEAVFLQNGTEAFFRRILGVKGRRNHKVKNIFIEPTLGLRPLTVQAQLPGLGYNLLWEMTSEGEAILINQLVFRRDDGTFEHVQIRPGLLKHSLSSYGDEWRSWQLVTCIAGPDSESELQEVLGSALDGMKDSREAFEQSTEIEGEMRALISLPYVQAIAKIAFHFALTRFHFTGFEPEFEELKRFIYSGAGKQPAWIAEEPLLPQLLPENSRLLQWSHLLTAEVKTSSFIARLQFFAGPRLKPFTWHVDLGKNPSRIIEEMAMGFRYYYYDEPDSSGYTGGIEQLRLGPKVFVKS